MLFRSENISLQLIGKKVVFNTQIDQLVTRVTADGFNTGDSMYVYRQGTDINGNYSEEETRTGYELKTIVQPGTNIVIKDEWFSLDSLKWENGKPVRFRAWAKSSISNYNDYLYADYVNIASPTENVLLIFKHLGCRIGFIPFSGNEIYRIEICTDPDDYMRADNAGSPDEDMADKYPEDQAIEIAARVQRIYNQMCAPAGVDMENNGTLLARGLNNSTVKEGSVTVDNTIRPDWASNINGGRYMISTPYDMTSANSGQPITLPAETRFRVYLYDVNNGDDKDTPGYEGTYHVFSLNDIKVNGVAKYEDGLTLQGGQSHVFRVGYQYGRLTVTTLNGFDWIEEEILSDNATDNTTTNQMENYQWWIYAMNQAADETINDGTRNICS